MRLVAVAVAVAGVMLAACGHASHRALPPAPTTSSTVKRVVTTTTVPLTTYTVRRGDTLTTIANRFRIPALSIVALNHIANPDVLAEGRVLRIPPAPPLRLVVTPHTGTQGQAFHLTLTGAPPNQQVTFEVHKPGGIFTGPPHDVNPDGTVSATYQTGLTDPPGRYTVVAKGRAGPITRATIVVKASTPPT
jgi:LysM repeat protein